jgi:cytochrome P450
MMTERAVAARAIPSVSRARACRESRRMIANPLAVFLDHSRRLGENYYYYFGGAKKVLVTCDPAVLRHVLKDDYENFHKSDIQVRRMGSFMGNGLLTSHGEYWRTQRRLIQQGFRPTALAALAPAMNASLEESLKHLERAAADGPVDLGTAMMQMTFTMVARSLFSAHMSDDDIQRISNAIITIQHFMVRQIVHPYLAPWFRVSGELRRHQDLRRAGDGILMRHITARRGSPRTPPDLLQILLDAVYADGHQMTDEQILSESMQLLVAGHETSSNALTWTLYLLARHPEYLQRARAEFEDVVGDEPLGYAHVPQLQLATKIIEESLRLYPPFWMVDRVAITDSRVGDIEIPRGTTLICFLYGAHHSERLWDEPARFYPERFAEDDRKTGRNFSYLPFGGGARGCIGANYALLQMLIILNGVLRRYEYSLTDPGPAEMAPMFILRPSGGISAHVRRATMPTVPTVPTM